MGRHVMNSAAQLGGRHQAISPNAGPTTVRGQSSASQIGGQINAAEPPMTMLNSLHGRATQRLMEASSLRNRLQELVDRLRGDQPTEMQTSMVDVPGRAGSLGILMDLHDAIATQHDAMNLLLCELEERIL